MRDLIRAELLKLRTTRMFWGNVIAVAGLRARWRRPRDHAAARTPLDSADGIRHVMAAASSGGHPAARDRHPHDGRRVPPRHGDVDLPDQPGPAAGDRREARRRDPGRSGRRASLPSLLTLAVALPWLAAEDVATSAYTSEVVAALLGSVGATVLGAVVGVGFGTLVRNQTAAITIALVWTQVVEGILVGLRARGRQVAPGRCRERPGRRVDAERRPAADGRRRRAAHRLRARLRGRRRVDPRPAGHRMTRAQCRPWPISS